MALDPKIGSWLRTLGPSGAGEKLKTFLNGVAGQGSLTADGDNHTNSTDETTLASQAVSDLKAGDVIEVIFQCTTPDNNSTDTLTLKLYVGTEEIVTSGAVDVADDDIGYIHAFITIRTGGSSGAVQGCGVVGLGVEGTVTAKPFRKDSAAEDVSGSVTIAVKGDWSVAHADNDVHAEVFLVKVHRA